jgi:hypothetical protein
LEPVHQKWTFVISSIIGYLAHQAYLSVIQMLSSITYLPSLSKSVVTIVTKTSFDLPKMSLPYQVVGLKGLCTLPYLAQS